VHPALSVHSALARGAFAVAVLVSLAVLFAPAGEVPDAPPGVDKVVHLVLFLALAVTGRWAGVRAVVLGLLLVAYGAGSEVPDAPPGVDKVVHLVLFLALAVTGRWAGARAVVLGALLVTYGAGSEVLQAVTPLERSGSVADLLADTVGVALGLGAWALGKRARRARSAGVAHSRSPRYSARKTAIRWIGNRKLEIGPWSPRAAVDFILVPFRAQLRSAICNLQPDSRQPRRLSQV